MVRNNNDIWQGVADILNEYSEPLPESSLDAMCVYLEAIVLIIIEKRNEMDSWTDILVETWKLEMCAGDCLFFKSIFLKRALLRPTIIFHLRDDGG